MTLFEQVKKVAELQKYATPGPWFLHSEADGDEAGYTHTNHSLVPQPGPTNEAGEYNDLANVSDYAVAEFLKEAGSLDFAALATALAAPATGEAGGAQQAARIGESIARDEIERAVTQLSENPYLRPLEEILLNDKPEDLDYMTNLDLLVREADRTLYKQAELLTALTPPATGAASAAGEAALRVAFAEASELAHLDYQAAWEHIKEAFTPKCDGCKGSGFEDGMDHGFMCKWCDGTGMDERAATPATDAAPATGETQQR